MHLRMIKNLSVPQKLVGGFLLVSVITAIVGMVSYRIISGNIQTIEALINRDVTFLKEPYSISVLRTQSWRDRIRKRDKEQSAEKPEKGGRIISVGGENARRGHLTVNGDDG